jgi:hypothetical protein
MKRLMILAALAVAAAGSAPLMNAGTALADGCTTSNCAHGAGMAHRIAEPPSDGCSGLNCATIVDGGCSGSNCERPIESSGVHAHAPASPRSIADGCGSANCARPAEDSSALAPASTTVPPRSFGMASEPTTSDAPGAGGPVAPRKADPALALIAISLSSQGLV